MFPKLETILSVLQEIKIQRVSPEMVIKLIRKLLFETEDPGGRIEDDVNILISKYWDQLPRAVYGAFPDFIYHLDNNQLEDFYDDLKEIDTENLQEIRIEKTYSLTKKGKLHIEILIDRPDSLGAKALIQGFDGKESIFKDQFFQNLIKKGYKRWQIEEVWNWAEHLNLIKEN